MNYNIDLEIQLDKLKNDEMHILFFVDLAVENIRKEPEYIKSILDRALEISLENKYDFAYSCCLIYIGWYYYYRSEIDIAIHQHLLAYKIFLELDNEIFLMRVCNALMSDYVLIGAFDIGLEYGLQAIEIANMYDDSDMKTRLLVNTADAYTLGEYYQNAIDMVNSLLALEYEVRLVDKVHIFNILGEAYYNLENYQEGYYNCQKALDIIEEYDLEFYKPEVLLAIAPIEFKLGNYDNALINFKKGIELSEKHNNSNIKMNLLLRWAICDLTNNQQKDAKRKLEQAIEEALNKNSTLMLSKLYEQLSKTYNSLEQYKEAYDSIELARYYEKLIYTKNNSLWFAKLNAFKTEEETKIYKELYDRINTISKIGKSLTTKLKISEILSSVYEIVKDLLKADCFAVAIYNEEEERLDYELFIELGEEIVGCSTSIYDDTSIGVFAIKNKVDILMNDFENDYKKYVPEYFIFNEKVEKVPQSLIYCPLIKNNKILGLITVQNYQKNAYDQKDLSTLDLLVSYIVIAIDNAKLFKEVEFLATHDHMTETINRREIMRLGDINLDSISPENKLSTIIIDVDYFKQINDKFGHSAGDEVLIQVSRMINQGVRKTDYVGRYGGEEFLIVLPNTNASSAKIIGERIRENIEVHQFSINKITKTNVSISLGLYEFGNGEKSFYEGIKRADKGLYKAKELGRNRLIEYKE